MCRKCDEFIKYSSDIGDEEKEQERLAIFNIEIRVLM